MDLTQICSTFPQLEKTNIQRENMIMTVEKMLENCDVIIVEGEDGAGKTTLLAQFACSLPEQTFCLFMRSSSRWAYDSQMLTRDLCDQIGWALHKEDYLEKGG
jgi:ABC-type phosphate/phosphonate transport system ATPase subunit